MLDSMTSVKAGPADAVIASAAIGTAARSNEP